MNDPYGQQQGGQDPGQYGQQQGGDQQSAGQQGGGQQGGGYPSNMPPPQPQQSAQNPAGATPYGYGAAPYGTPQQNHTLAIVSLICSIAGIVVCGPAAIAGVITGHMARRRIRENPSAYTGDGMALAGLIIGWIMTALFVVVVIGVIIAVVLGASQGSH